MTRKHKPLPSRDASRNRLPGAWGRDLMRRDAETAAPRRAARSFLRKEVIQPQVPLRLPCYDFTPVADLTVVGRLFLRS